MAVKKTTQKEGSSWVGEVEKYSRKIWLAGLGVYSKVSSDGGKYFETLVKDGEKAEKLTKSTVGKKLMRPRQRPVPPSRVFLTRGASWKKPSTSASTVLFRDWACLARLS